MRLKCEFKNKKKYIIHVTYDFNWLNTCELKTEINWKTTKSY